MNNVISINFNKNTFGPVDNFLENCKQELDENDYADLIDAINDEIFYETCDTEIQDLVIAYFDIVRNS